MMRSAPVATYQPDLIAVLVGGQIIVGYAQDSFVQIARDADMWEKMTGADGITARAKKNDRTGTITLTLMHTSPSNDYLSSISLADETTDGGVLVPVGVEDKLGNTVCFAAQAWVKKLPDIEFGNTIGTRQWVIATGDLTMVVGGSKGQ